MSGTIRQFWRAGLTVGFTRTVNAAIAILIIPLFLVIYGPDVYGRLSFFLALPQYAMIFDLGFSATLVRLRANSGRTTWFLPLAWKLTGGATVVLVVGGVFLSFFSDLRNSLLPAAMILTWSTLGTSFLASLWQGDLRYEVHGVVVLVRNWIPQAVAVIMFSITGVPSLAIWGLALGALAVTLGVALAARRYDGERARPGGPVVTGNPPRITELVGETASFSVQNILATTGIPLIHLAVQTSAITSVVAAFDVSRRVSLAVRNLFDGAMSPLLSLLSRPASGEALSDTGRITAQGTVVCSIGALALAMGSFLVDPAVRFLDPTLLLGPELSVVGPLVLVSLATTMPHIAAYYALSSSPKGRLANIGANAFPLVLIGIFYMGADYPDWTWALQGFALGHVLVSIPLIILAIQKGAMWGRQ